MLKQISQGRAGRHPLHPLLVHLPVGLWVATLVFDILNRSTDNSDFAVASFYCLTLGLIGALLALPTGIIELLHTPERSRPRSIAVTHAVLNVIATILALVSFSIRKGYQNGLFDEVPWIGLIFSVLTVAILGVSGYLGGILTFQYGIGRTPQKRDTEDADRRAA